MEKREEVVQALLPHLQDQCNITWDLDAQEERHLARILEDAIDYFLHRTGPDLEVKKGPARALVLNRAMYDWNRMLEFFENNYHLEISQLLVSYGATKLAEAEQEG